MSSVDAPSRQTVTGPVIPETWISTIFVVPVTTNGVAEGGAGLTVGSTVAVAVPLVVAKFNETFGRVAVAGISATVIPEGILATWDSDVEPVAIDATGRAGVIGDEATEGELEPTEFTAVTEKL